MIAGEADFTVLEPEDLVAAVAYTEYNVLITHELRLFQNGNLYIRTEHARCPCLTELFSNETISYFLHIYIMHYFLFIYLFIIDVCDTDGGRCSYLSYIFTIYLYKLGRSNIPGCRKCMKEDKISTSLGSVSSIS